MSSEDSTDVTLAKVDPALVSCWDRLVKQGKECSLLLKHSKGRVVATLQCTSTSSAFLTDSSPSLTSPAKRKKRRGGKKKRLEALLAYQQRLVVEKGLPPSRLMVQHAAASSNISSSADQSPGLKAMQFKCYQCNFSSKSKRDLKVHIGRNHKDIQTPEGLRGGELENSLNISELSENREECSSVFKADHSTLSSTPLKEMINDSVRKSSADDREPPHKCSPVIRCSKAACKPECTGTENLWCKLRIAREKEKNALANPCKNCEAKMYKYECCSEESGLCPDCCDELGACLN